MRFPSVVFMPDAAGDGDPAGEGRPEWLPEQFKSPEDLARSYDESRREMNRLQAQVKEQQEQFQSAIEMIQQQPAPAPVQQQGQFDPMSAAYEKAYLEGDTAAMLRLTTEAASKPVISAVGQLIDEKLGAMQPVIEQQQQAQRESQIRMAEDLVARQVGPDRYQQNLQKVSELIQQRPHYLPATATVEGYAQAISDVLKLAEHESLQQAAQQLEVERAEKLAAGTMSGAGRGSAFTPDQQQAEWDRVKSAEIGSYAQLRGR